MVDEDQVPSKHFLDRQPPPFAVSGWSFWKQRQILWCLTCTSNLGRLAEREELTSEIGVDRGPPWHKLRQEEFSDVHFAGLSGALVKMIRNLMRTDPGRRVTVQTVCNDPVVCRARAWMTKRREEAIRDGLPIILGSPLAEERDGFVRDILGVEQRMELC